MMEHGEYLLDFFLPTCVMALNSLCSELARHAAAEPCCPAARCPKHDAAACSSLSAAHGVGSCEMSWDPALGEGRGTVPQTYTATTVPII